MGVKTYESESLKSESPWDDECSLLVNNQSSLINNNVFPPINHEGLHIHSQIFPQPLHQFNATSSPSRKPKVSNSPRSLWFKFMHQGMSFVHSRLQNYSVSSIVSFLFSPATVVVVVFWYWRVLRRRRALRKESRDKLIGIVAEKDEEISKLMRQIAQMNKLLCRNSPPSPRAT
ncbi:hypothetical protein ACET3Z_017347 [Daucus carota]